MKRKIIEWWKNSRIFKVIDNLISTHFQRKLKNDNFTILCSNCVGGGLYHRLGKEFLSPTINLFMSNPDFVEFCVHLDYYLNQKLTFIQSDKPHPVALLIGNGGQIPDITINFNHDTVNKEAEEKWERRKERINRDNLYFIFYNLDDISIAQIKKLETVPCKNKVLLTAFPCPEISWSHYIKPNMKAQYPFAYLDKDLFGVRHIEKSFDFVGFLNT